MTPADLLKSDQPALTIEQRAPLREAVREQQRHAGDVYMTDAELQVTLRRLDGRLAIAEANAVASNRARGTVRELRLQRQQLLEQTDRQRLQVYDRSMRAKAATSRLIAGAPEPLRQAVIDAQIGVDDAKAQGRLISDRAPLEERIQRDWMISAAEQLHADAVRAAIDWDPPQPNG